VNGLKGKSFVSFPIIIFLSSYGLIWVGSGFHFGDGSGCYSGVGSSGFHFETG
jgi:hypothetical protein